MRLKNFLSATWTFICAAAETLASAVLVVVMYVLYLPFGIGRAIFSRQQVRDFYDDFFAVSRLIAARWRKTKTD